MYKTRHNALNRVRQDKTRRHSADWVDDQHGVPTGIAELGSRRMDRRYGQRELVVLMIDWKSDGEHFLVGTDSMIRLSRNILLGNFAYVLLRT